MNITQNNGFEFLVFLKINEEDLKKHSPIAGSFAVIKCEGKVLMVYNKWRKQWELPAGQRDGEETPKECAKRELYEETGQEVTDLEFWGLIKLKNVDLPAPFGTMIAVILPCSISKSTLSTAVRPPNFLVIPFTSINATLDSPCAIFSWISLGPD